MVVIVVRWLYSYRTECVTKSWVHHEIIESMHFHAFEEQGKGVLLAIEMASGVNPGD